MSIFTGAGVALVTPMHADGSVNFDKMKEMRERKYTKYYEKVHNQWKSYST